MRFSDFGSVFGGPTGIMDLMDDMGKALAGGVPMLMLGGGNPAHISSVNDLWRRQLTEILAEEGKMERMLANYDTPQGQPSFIRALTELLNREFGWSLGPENVAITNGSQTAFYLLFNMLTGSYGGGDDPRPGRVLFPLMPEYIGYADQTMDPRNFIACRPLIERPRDHLHKYHVDFAAVEGHLAASAAGGERICAICVSRPTNPSGNVLTDGEMTRLDDLARRYQVPLIVDNAYGVPFPHIIFDDVIDGSARPLWNENIILGMSLSKIGLPGTRTGILVARSEIVSALSRANAVLSLANTTVGQYLVEPLLRDGSLLEVARKTIMPFYRERADHAHHVFTRVFPDSLPWSVHRTEGSLFVWLWLEGLPLSSRELYERLKKRGVLVVPGEYFFFGDPLLAEWPHSRECLRINYGQDPAVVEEGLRIIADEVTRAWG
ncbi:hypothetical protein AU468_11275 [Alkalispirochaeta sphaeroplastigenens]|uniref:Aminotransferase class I/classII large domain-containing protein n=1 Tax=Alkalispirochaeta sphaeroplastigenens TaxID=1187066 RepID=A0A2S4JHF3_9SPIO|nr:valine--pyruvate transaminase [Alkalispirochaeta sphaeroplastigenens]POQ98966.1 hypothetical protein AU468_11275 [Alkalispirochaeta sphaeroplastigenens]